MGILFLIEIIISTDRLLDFIFAEIQVENIRVRMSGNDSDDDKNIPSAQECEKRCQEFAEVTGTDTALAMFFLQDRDWDVQRSVNAFFNEQAGVSDSPTETSEVANDDEVTMISQDLQPNRIRILSWNIDGLDTNNIKNRTKGVCHAIQQDNPDVVFLQEVIPETFAYIEAKCDVYQCIQAGNSDYFTAMMLKKTTTAVHSHRIIPFHSSMMLRNLLIVQAKVKGLECQLMTTHLESTKSHAAERIRQLNVAFEEMKNADVSKTVVFGGDLNLRDTELPKIGGVPDRIYDIWEVTGKRPEAKFTWDTMRNDNCHMEGGKFKPRCRFDRLYVRNSNPKTMKPVYFELAGIERLPSCQRFPSDHWGILAHFDKT